MDTPLYPTFPQPPPRCPKSLPRLTTSVAFTRRDNGDVRGETPVMPTATVNFTTFLSAKSTVLRVAATGNHPSSTTAARTLLTEIGDVRLIPSPWQPHSSSDKVLTGLVPQAPLPASIWAVKSGWAAGCERDKSSLFCVYRTHREVCINHLTILASPHWREGGNHSSRFYRAKS